MKHLSLILVLGCAASALADEAPNVSLERTAAVHITGDPWANGLTTAQIYTDAGVVYMHHGRYEEALQSFRTAAVADPEAPHLAALMLHAKHEADRAEAERLGAQKEQQFEDLLAEGKAKLAQNRYEDARSALGRALSLKPGDMEAATLLAQANDEPIAKEDQHVNGVKPVTKSAASPPNPAASEQHYEAGLVAYAMHNLPEAKKEWLLAERLDKGHPKVGQAIRRVEEELALQVNAPAVQSPKN